MHTGMEMEMDQNMELQRIETMLHQLLDRSGKHETMTALNTQKLDNVDKNVEELKERTKENEETLNSHAKIIDRWKWALGIIGPFALLAASWLARKILPVLFVAFVAHGQIAPDQLRTTTDSPTQLWAGTGSGFVPVRIGAGITIQKDASGFVVSAASAPAITSIRAIVVTLTATNGAYQTSAVLIFRNGVLQLEGVNYTRGPTGVVPSTAWAATDTVVGVSFQPG